MKEEFLHFVWKNGLYTGLHSSGFKKTEVIHPGTYNRDAGPDFFNARIRLDGMEWAGNVEIHLRSSDWYKHGHDTDPFYDAIILHVVWEQDRRVLNSRGEEVPEVRVTFDQSIYEKYREYLFSPAWVPCEKDFGKTSRLLQEQWAGVMAVERLERKTGALQSALKETSGDWEEVFYQLLARHLGMRVNAEPMEQLARSVPLKFIRKHLSDPQQVEAFLFGQAGLLDSGILPGAVQDEYFNLLLREYRFLQNKFSLKPLPAFRWKFHRLRPANFPTLRIAQLAAILMNTPRLFSVIREEGNTQQIKALFTPEVSEYWNQHYLFGRTKDRVFTLGTQALQNILINGVVPILFTYGKVRDQEQYSRRAADLLEQLPPEDNRIVRGWKKLGVDIPDAAHSQGFLQLKNVYCDHRRCLDCRIGALLISRHRKLLEGNRVLLEPESRRIHDPKDPQPD